MATSVATADRDDSHWAASTLAEVTVSGGMANDLPALIITLIWPPLIPTSTATTARRPTMAMIHVMRLRGCFPAGFEDAAGPFGSGFSGETLPQSVCMSKDPFASFPLRCHRARIVFHSPSEGVRGPRPRHDGC